MNLTGWAAQMPARLTGWKAGQWAGREGVADVVKRYLIAFLVLLSAVRAEAQNSHFVSSGKITFEKKVNNTALMKSMGGGFGPQRSADDKKADFTTTQATLAFNRSRSLFVNIAPQTGRDGFFGNRSSDTKTMANLANHTYTMAKGIAGQQVMVADTLPKVKWRLVNELRDIAGYSCKRANGLLYDSVYVVAYYAEQIIPQAGPERVTGLPGTILGLAIPDQHVTYFATKVEERPVTEADLTLPESRNARQMNLQQLKETVAGFRMPGGRNNLLPMLLMQ